MRYLLVIHLNILHIHITWLSADCCVPIDGLHKKHSRAFKKADLI